MNIGPTSIRRVSPSARAAFTAFLIAALCLLSGNSSRADTPVPDERVPDENGRQTTWVSLWPEDHPLSEATFFEELSLVFDSPEVEHLEIPEGFNDMPARQKQAAVLQHFPHAAVAVWPGNLDERPVIHVLSLAETNNVNEVGPSTVDATSLSSAALAVKELVSALPQSPASRPSTPEPAERTAQIRQMRDEESPWRVHTPKIPQSKKFRDDLSVGATLYAQGDFTGTGGEHYTLFGGGLRLTKRPRERTDLRVSIGGGTGPHIDADDISLTGWWVSPVLEAVVSGRIGRIRMGPAFQIIGFYQSIRFKSRVDSSVTQTTVNNWNLLVGLGPAFSARLNDACSIGWVAGAVVPVSVYSYALPEYGYESEVKTPIVSWRIALSIDIHMPRRKKSKDSPPAGYSRQKKAAVR